MADLAESRNEGLAASSTFGDLPRLAVYRQTTIGEDNEIYDWVSFGEFIPNHRQHRMKDIHSQPERDPRRDIRTNLIPAVFAFVSGAGELAISSTFFGDLPRWAV